MSKMTMTYLKMRCRRPSFVTAAWLAFLFIFALSVCFDYADDMSVLNSFGGARSGFYLSEDADDDLDDRLFAESGGRTRQKLAYYLETPDMSVAYQVNQPPARLSANGGYSSARGFAERKAVKIRDNLDDGDGADSVPLGFAREKYGIVRNISLEYSHHGFYPLDKMNDIKTDYRLALRRYEAQAGVNPGALNSRAAFISTMSRERRSFSAHIRRSKRLYNLISNRREAVCHE